MSLKGRILRHPLLRRYAGLVREDLSATYARDLHKWLIIAPILGVLSGLLITLVSEVVLRWMWPPLLKYYLEHPSVIVPCLTVGFITAGLLMQKLTPNPDEHSTEEIIQSYHEHQGDVDMKSFAPKLLAAIATVGSGGSAALEGPSIYGGGAIGSWAWTICRKMQKMGLRPRDRRIMLISGAAAGMSAVFRAPLTGIIFALEMPYKDDLAHEALLPSLIASVVSYATMAAFLGAEPLFDFASSTSYTRTDLAWSAALGLACGLVAMTFAITFRRLRAFVVKLRTPHWIKMAAGGAVTGACGLAFLWCYPGQLIPIGPNYEAVGQILQGTHGTLELVTFGGTKLLATLASLGVGGVSAMFVPLFLTGGGLGVAFAQSVAHSSAVDLYAAVGMASFIAAAYKTPLTAVVFVAEATGGHAYIVPALIGAAVAYAVSGEASVSGDQHLHEAVSVAELSRIRVGEVMKREVVTVDAEMNLADFAKAVTRRHAHAAYPVYDGRTLCGIASLRAAAKVPAGEWEQTPVRAVMDKNVKRVLPDTDAMEAMRLLAAQSRPHMLVVESKEGELEGVITKSDILSALDTQGGTRPYEA